jgi:hypothetical protein
LYQWRTSLPGTAGYGSIPAFPSPPRSQCRSGSVVYALPSHIHPLPLFFCGSGFLRRIDLTGVSLFVHFFGLICIFALFVFFLGIFAFYIFIFIISHTETFFNSDYILKLLTKSAENY